MAHGATPSPPSGGACASCGAPLQGRFCHACGERRLQPAHDHSLLAFLEDVFEGLTHLDNRVLRAFQRLLLAPGRLTDDHLHGRRVQVASPVQVFLLTCVAFYLFFQSAYVTPFENLAASYRTGSLLGNPFRFDIDTVLAEHAAAAQRTPAEQRAIAVEKASHFARLFMGAIVPFWALCIWPLCRRRYRQFVPHLVFAVHAFTVFLLLDLVFLGVHRVVATLRGMRDLSLGDMDFLPLLAAFAVHLLLAVRRVYRPSWPAAVAQTVVAVAALVGWILLYRHAVAILAVLRS